MSWADINLKQRTWHQADNKTGRSHLMPLPDAAVDVLGNLPRLVGSPWGFPSHSRTGRLVEPKGAWACILENAAVKGVRIHDLRRTVGAWLATQVESLSMIGKVLNHSQPSTTAIYAQLHLDHLPQSNGRPLQKPPLWPNSLSENRRP